MHRRAFTPLHRRVAGASLAGHHCDCSEPTSPTHPSFFPATAFDFGPSPPKNTRDTPMSKTLRVLSPGMLTTVQDLGRYAYAHLGVSASGPADGLSARISNRLVGNVDNTSVLEMTLVGGHFEF